MVTTPNVSADEAAVSSATDVAAVVTPDHDRLIQPVGPGRIQFKGHQAKAGYPYRVYEGQVQALVDGAWVEAVDSTRLEE